MADFGKIYRGYIAITVDYATAVINTVVKVIGKGLERRFDEPIKRTYGDGSIVGLANIDNDAMFIDDEGFKTAVRADNMTIQELIELGNRLERFIERFCKEDDECIQVNED